MDLDKKGFSSEIQDDLKSWVQATDPTIVRTCPTCGNECKTGQPLWNGWFVYEELYHLGCMPDKYKKQFGIGV